jgi:hypothetical protein
MPRELHFEKGRTRIGDRDGSEEGEGDDHPEPGVGS